MGALVSLVRSSFAVATDRVCVGLLGARSMKYDLQQIVTGAKARNDKSSYHEFLVLPLIQAATQSALIFSSRLTPRHAVRIARSRPAVRFNAL